MNCESLRENIEAFADGELEADCMAEAAAHLESCDACARRVAHVQKLKAALSKRFEQQQMPDGLADRVRGRVRREADQPSGIIGGFQKWVVPLGMAAAIVFVWQASLWFDGGTADVGGVTTDVEARFVSEARTRHRECARLGADHNRAGLVLDAENVRRVFSRELGLRVLVPDLSTFGYRLQSADTCGMGKTRGAHVVYEHETDAEILSIFTLEKRSGFEPTEGLLVGGGPCFVRGGPGPTLVAWHDGKATYVLCSTADFNALRPVAESIR